MLEICIAVEAERVFMAKVDTSARVVKVSSHGFRMKYVAFKRFGLLAGVHGSSILLLDQKTQTGNFDSIRSVFPP